MINLPSSLAKGEVLTFALNKSLVMAAVSDSYWSDAANISKCIVVYASTSGHQRKRLEFDFSQESPTVIAEWSVKARNGFEIEEIVLIDFDSGSYTVPRASLPSGKGISFAGENGGGGGGAIVTQVVHNYIPNGAINDMVTDGSNVYIGGAFTSLRFMASNMTSVNASTAAPQLTSLDGFPQFVYTPSPANTRINAIVFDGPNTIFVAGRFNQMDGEDRRGLAKLIRSGSRWIPDPSWHDGTTNRMTDGNISWGVEVYHISIDGDNLIITGSWGQYKNPDGTVVTGIRRFHVVNKNTGVFQFGYSTTSTANAAGVHKVVGDWIYVAGRIPEVDGTGVTRVFNLARFNRTTGVRDTSFTDPSVTYPGGGNINSIFEHNGSVFVAGGFSAFGGQTKKALVKLNSSDGLVDSSFSIPTTTVTVAIWDAKPDGNGNVFLCGQFNDSANLGRNIVKLSLDDGTRVGSFNAGNIAYRAGLASSVRKVIVESGHIYIFGQFSGQNTSSDPLTVRNVAKLDITSGALDTGFASVDYMQDPATEIAQTGLVDGSNLIIGGSFSGYGGYSRQGVAKLTKDEDGNWKVVEAFNTSSGGTTVNTLALSGNDLYIGGTFTTWAGAARNRVAKLNATTGALDPSFGVGVFTSGLTTGQFNGVTNRVNKVVVDGSDLVIGGAFTTYSRRSSSSASTNTATPYWIRVNTGNNTETVPTAGASATIRGIAISGNDIFFCGGFSQWGGVNSYRIAKVNKSTLVQDTGFVSPFTSTVPAVGPVSVFVSSNGTVWTFGVFSTIIYAGSQSVGVVAMDRNTGAQVKTYAPTDWGSGVTATDVQFSYANAIESGGYIYIIGSKDYYVSHARLVVRRVTLATHSVDLTWGFVNVNAANDVFGAAMVGSEFILGGDIQLSTGTVLFSPASKLLYSIKVSDASQNFNI